METRSIGDVVSASPKPGQMRDWNGGPVSPDIAAMEDGRIFNNELLPHIRKACDHSGGRFTPEGCIRRWLDGQWLMWAVNAPNGHVAAVFFTQLNVYPDTGLRTLEVCLLGGSKVRAWIHLEPLLLQYALEFECSRVEAWSRSGLIDLLPRWRRNYILEIETK